MALIDPNPKILRVLSMVLRETEEERIIWARMAPGLFKTDYRGGKTLEIRGDSERFVYEFFGYDLYGRLRLDIKRDRNTPEGVFLLHKLYSKAQFQTVVFFREMGIW